MNSNLFHNLANIGIAILAGVTAFLISTGCTVLPTGALECSSSWINPTYTTVAVSALSVLKIGVNVIRDGLTGLAKRQPPVQ